MRLLLCAACALGLFATMSSGQAQSTDMAKDPQATTDKAKATQATTDKAKGATKVYAYKQRAPNAAAPAPAFHSEPMRVPYSVADPASVPYGSARWWEIHQRASGGSSEQ
jgi:hypothetical protein